MAAPTRLAANTPGGNSYRQSAKAQKPVKGKAAPMATKPAARKFVAKRSSANAHGSVASGISTMSQADMRPNMTHKKIKDYASAWMQSHGLKNAQNAGTVPRVPYASVPADLIGAGTGTRTALRKSVSRHKATINPSGKTTAKRVNTRYTGRNFKSTAKSRIVPARKS